MPIHQGHRDPRRPALSRRGRVAANILRAVRPSRPQPVPEWWASMRPISMDRTAASAPRQAPLRPYDPCIAWAGPSGHGVPRDPIDLGAPCARWTPREVSSVSGGRRRSLVTVVWRAIAGSIPTCQASWCMRRAATSACPSARGTQGGRGRRAVVDHGVGNRAPARSRPTALLGPPLPEGKLMLRGDVDSRTHEDPGGEDRTQDLDRTELTVQPAPYYQ
jgi:hypothetical protein